MPESLKNTESFENDKNLKNTENRNSRKLSAAQHRPPSGKSGVRAQAARCFIHCLRVVRHVASSDRISGLIMLGFALTGLLLANVPFTAHVFELISEFEIGIPYAHIELPISEWAQDGLLTVFFLVVGLDLKQELTTGSLANPRTAAVPMISAVGGMIAPVLIYISVIAVVGAGTGTNFSELLSGWAIPTATDIAFSLAVLALFARNLPGSIRAFLIALATVDDLLGIIVIALFFSDLNAWYWFLGVTLCAAVWAFLVRMRKVPWLLVGIIGILTWIMMFKAGIHPTLAGVLVGLLTPSLPIFDEKTSRAERYGEKLNPLSAIIALPIFALFATGVHFESFGVSLFTAPVVMAIICALVIGKPLGVMATAWVSTRILKLKLPQELMLKDLIPLATACGVGFTVSFLMASLSFSNELYTNEARFGVLIGSLISAGIAGALFHLQSKSFAKNKS